MNTNNKSLTEYSEQIKDLDLIEILRLLEDKSIRRDDNLLKIVEQEYKEKFLTFSEYGNNDLLRDRIIKQGILKSTLSPNSRAIPIIVLMVIICIGLVLITETTETWIVIVFMLLAACPQLLRLFKNEKVVLADNGLSIFRRGKLKLIQYRWIIKIEVSNKTAFVWYLEDGKICKETFELKMTGTFNSLSKDIKGALLVKQTPKACYTTNEYDDLTLVIYRAILESKEQIDLIFPNEKIFGFALCTDDDLSTLYHVMCTKKWVAEHSMEYSDIGYMSTEWEQSVDNSIFEKSNEMLDKLYKKAYPTDSEWSRARDRRFEALVLALEKIRSQDVFDVQTLLLVSSTDPSEYLQELDIKAAIRLNKNDAIKNYIKAKPNEKN